MQAVRFHADVIAYVQQEWGVESQLHGGGNVPLRRGRVAQTDRRSSNAEDDPLSGRRRSRVALGQVQRIVVERRRAAGAQMLFTKSNRLRP